MFSTTPSCSTSTSSPVTTASRPARAPMLAGATRRNSRIGAYARAVFGESYQLAGQNPFDVNSGLGTTSSDYVTRPLPASGEIFVARGAGALQRGDVRSDAHRSRREANVGPVDITVNYAEVAPEAVSPIRSTANNANHSNQPRDQEIVGKGTLALTDTWALLGAIRYDLENAKTISDGVGLQYEDDCLTLAVTYEQSNIQDQDIQPDQTSDGEFVAEISRHLSISDRSVQRFRC